MHIISNAFFVIVSFISVPSGLTRKFFYTFAMNNE